MTNAEIKAHWCYVRDLLNCEIPDGTMLTKDQHIERVGFHYVTAMRHAEKHCREDFENGVFEPGKVVGASHWPDVSENQVVGEISVSGDRVKSDDDGWKAALKDHYGAARPTTINENEKKDPRYGPDD